MKNIFSAFNKPSKKDSDRLVNTALNRERLISFSKKLKTSSTGDIINDYSVEEEELISQFNRSPKPFAN